MNNANCLDVEGDPEKKLTAFNFGQRYHALAGIEDVGFGDRVRGGLCQFQCLCEVEKSAKCTNMINNVVSERVEDILRLRFDVKTLHEMVYDVAQLRQLVTGPYLHMAISVRDDWRVVPGFVCLDTAVNNRQTLQLRTDIKMAIDSIPSTLSEKLLPMVNAGFAFGDLPVLRRYSNLVMPSNEEYDTTAFWVRCNLYFTAQAQLEQAQMMSANVAANSHVLLVPQTLRKRLLVYRRTGPGAVDNVAELSEAYANQSFVLMSESVSAETAYVIWVASHDAPFIGVFYRPADQGDKPSLDCRMWASCVRCNSGLNGDVHIVSDSLYKTASEVYGLTAINGSISLSSSAEWCHQAMEAVRLRQIIANLAIEMSYESHLLVASNFTALAAYGHVRLMSKRIRKDVSVDAVRGFQTEATRLVDVDDLLTSDDRERVLKDSHRAVNRRTAEEQSRMQPFRDHLEAIRRVLSQRRTSNLEEENALATVTNRHINTAVQDRYAFTNDTRDMGEEALRAKVNSGTRKALEIWCALLDLYTKGQYWKDYHHATLHNLCEVLKRGFGDVVEDSKRRRVPIVQVNVGGRRGSSGSRDRQQPREGSEHTAISDNMSYQPPNISAARLEQYREDATQRLAGCQEALEIVKQNAILEAARAKLAKSISEEKRIDNLLGAAFNRRVFAQFLVRDKYIAMRAGLPPGVELQLLRRTAETTDAQYAVAAGSCVISEEEEREMVVTWKSLENKMIVAVQESKKIQSEITSLEELLVVLKLAFKALVDKMVEMLKTRSLVVYAENGFLVSGAVRIPRESFRAPMLKSYSVESQISAPAGYGLADFNLYLSLDINQFCSIQCLMNVQAAESRQVALDAYAMSKLSVIATYPVPVDVAGLNIDGTMLDVLRTLLHEDENFSSECTASDVTLATGNAHLQQFGYCLPDEYFRLVQFSRDVRSCLYHPLALFRLGIIDEYDHLYSAEEALPTSLRIATTCQLILVEDRVQPSNFSGQDVDDVMQGRLSKFSTILHSGLVSGKYFAPDVSKVLAMNMLVSTLVDGAVILERLAPIHNFLNDIPIFRRRDEMAIRRHVTARGIATRFARAGLFTEIDVRFASLRVFDLHVTDVSSRADFVPHGSYLQLCDYGQVRSDRLTGLIGISNGAPPIFDSRVLGPKLVARVGVKPKKDRSVDAMGKVAVVSGKIESLGVVLQRLSLQLSDRVSIVSLNNRQAIAQVELNHVLDKGPLSVENVDREFNEKTQEIITPEQHVEVNELSRLQKPIGELIREDHQKQ